MVRKRRVTTSGARQTVINFNMNDEKLKPKLKLGYKFSFLKSTEFSKPEPAKGKGTGKMREGNGKPGFSRDFCGNGIRVEKFRREKFGNGIEKFGSGKWFFPKLNLYSFDGKDGQKTNKKTVIF